MKPSSSGASSGASSSTPSGPGTDWQTLVRERAAATGVALPATTVDELSLHLDDVYRHARAGGLDHAAAVARAVAALEESQFAVLRRHAARATPPERTHLNITGALRQALRQFWQHPTFALVVV